MAFLYCMTAKSLGAVNKLDPASLAEGDLMDCRPVAMGNTLRKAVTGVLFDPFLQDIIAETKPMQFGCGEKAGGSQMIFAISLILEACPDFVCMALDLKNAYNKISREDCLEEVWRQRSLQPLWYYLWHTKCINAYVGLGSSKRMITAKFTSDEGEQQGAVESGFSFCICIDPINRMTNNELGRHGVPFLLVLTIYTCSDYLSMYLQSCIIMLHLLQQLVLHLTVKDQMLHQQAILDTAISHTLRRYRRGF